MIKESNDLSASISFEVDTTEENQEAISKLFEDCKKAEDEQRRHIVSMLMESAQQQVNDYIAQGASVSDTDTFKAIIYNAMAEGWNQCYTFHKDKIEQH